MAYTHLGGWTAGKLHEQPVYPPRCDDIAGVRVGESDLELRVFFPRLTMTEEHKHSLDAPKVGESYIGLIVKPTVLERTSCRFLIGVTREVAVTLRNYELEVQDAGQNPSGPGPAPIHFSYDTVKVLVGKTTPKITVTTSHRKRVH